MGNDSTDDLLDRENSLAEMIAEQEAVEAGGLGASGMSYYDDGGYNYDESSELTDIDENPYDDSKAFTESGDGTDAFANQFGRDDNEQTDAVQNEEPMGSMMRWGQPVAETYTDDYDEEEVDDYDGDDEDEDDENDDDDEEENGDVEENSNVIDAQQDDSQNGAQKAKSKKDDYNGAIKWKPGDEITIALLGQVWNKCRKIEKVRPLTDSANTAVSQALNALGPNVILRLNEWVGKIVDAESDTIGSLLDLASKNGKRMTYLTVSVVEAIFDQQWTQTAAIAALPIVLQGAIAVEPVKSILNNIFKIAVPIINRATKKK